MASYVKLWTSIRSNEDFLSLSGTARGAYLQLIVAAKDQRDDGTVCYRSVAAAGSDWGLDRRTASKVLTILQQKCLLSYTENGSGVITIQLPNYKEWQEIGVDGVRQKRRKNVTKIPSLRPDQSRADKNRQKPSSSVKKPPTEHSIFVKWWCEEYNNRFQTPYNFSAKDAKLIQGLLKSYKSDLLRQYAKRYWDTEDEFYSKNGYSVGVFNMKINAIAIDVSGTGIKNADAELHKEQKAIQRQIDEKYGKEFKIGG